MLLNGKAKIIGSVIGVCALTITIVIVLASPEELVAELAEDASLITNFKNHEAQFQQLATMANQDSAVMLVHDSFVSLSEGDSPPSYIYIYKDKTWPAEAQPLFSEERWREYLSVFQTLGLSGGMKRNPALPNAVFFSASVKVSELDNYEAAIVEKGYAYVPRSVKLPVRESLDNIDINRPAIFYRKLQDQWYLYYQWSLSKPE